MNGDSHLRIAYRPSGGGYMPSVKNFYDTAFDVSRGVCMWNVHRLTPARTIKHFRRDGSIMEFGTFRADPKIPGSPSADAYYGSGYDIGHMMPAEAAMFDRDALNDTFLTTNACPQEPNLNRGVWRKLEHKAFEKSKETDLVVICGPIYMQHGRKMKSGVAVPDSFFKVIVDPKHKLYGSWVMPNATDASPNLDDHWLPLDKVEHLSGLLFEGLAYCRPEKTILEPKLHLSMDLPRTLFVLGGGGCRAIEAHIGMLQALEEAGIQASEYRGASAGGLVSSFHASGMDSKALRAMLLANPTSKLWSTDWRFWTPFVTSYDYYRTDGLDALIDANVDESRTTSMVTVSITRQEDAESFLSPGVKWANKATKAMPEIFNRQQSPDGIWYVDGGVLNNIPVPLLSDAKSYDHIYILMCNDGPAASYTSGLKIERSLNWVSRAMDRQAEDIKTQWPGLPNVTVLQPPSYDSGLLDWSKNFGLVDAAYDYAKAALKTPALQVQRTNSLN